MEIEKIHIYRIFHIQNLEYILKSGYFCGSYSIKSDPDYVNIGNRQLIELRKNDSIYVLENGSIKKEGISPAKEYLPFYFAPRSVMLYQIYKGDMVEHTPQENIVHLVCKLENIINKAPYLFTDGHGHANFSTWYDNIEYINEIDWETVRSKNWADTEDDPDKKRRKQAEFWTKHEIAIEEITGLGVYNEAAKQRVTELCKKYNRNIAVKVKEDYYY